VWCSGAHTQAGAAVTDRMTMEISALEKILTNDSTWIALANFSA
jgi:hypothetical protein